MAPLVADELAARFPDDIRGLLTVMRASKANSLTVVECDDLDLRARLLDYFRRRLAADDIYMFSYEVSRTDTNLARRLLELTQQPRFKNLELSGQYRRVVIFVYGTEKFDTEQRGQFIRLLNFLRERLATLDQPVVIWGTTDFVARLAHQAADFWQAKSHFFSFASPNPRSREPSDAYLYADMSPTRRYLRRLIEDPDFSIWKELYLPLKANRAADLSPIVLRHTLTYAELRQIAPLFPETEPAEAGQIIFKRGESGDKCYIIVKGTVEVLEPDGLGGGMVINQLGKGDFFGEIGLIKKIPRTATVKTTAPCKFVTFTADALGKLNQRAPAVLDIITEIAQRRLETHIHSPQQTLSPLRRFAIEGANLIRRPPLDVRELISNDHRTVILGEAGAGKTTVLRRLTLDTAEQAEHLLNSAAEPIVLPIFLKLNALTPDRTLPGLILDVFRAHDISEVQTETDVNKLLNGHSLDETPVHSILFLLDGLNELPAQQQTRPHLDQFIRRNAQHRFIVSCRVQDYDPLRGFRTALIERLNNEDIEAFLVNYLSAEQGRRVAREIYNDPQLEDLAQSPLALYMFAQVAKQSDEALPKNRGALFQAFTTRLLERSDREWWPLFGQTESQIPLDLRREALADLGLAMQEAETLTYPAPDWFALIRNRLSTFRAAQPESLLQAIEPENVHEDIKHSGLLRQSGNQASVEFAHQTYQEFFAALGLRVADRDLEPLLKTSGARRHWQGTIILLYGIAEDTAALYSKILGFQNDYARIWLAAQSLANSGENLTLALNRLERTLPMQQHFALLFSVGLASRQLGRYPEALSYLHMAVEETPGSAEVQFELGSLYRQVEQYERAIAHLEEAIRLRSDFVDAYNQLGLTYYNQQKYVEALTIFKATTQLEPHNGYHFYNLGLIQKILHDYRAAHVSLHTALELRPDYSEAKAQLDILDKALNTGVIQVLDKIPLLSKMSLEQSVMLANRIRVEEYKAGQIVYHLGETGDTFYVIEDGSVEMLAPHSRGVISRLQPGDFFGEVALLRAVPRTATARVTSPARLLAISRADFDYILNRYASVNPPLAETSGLRLHRDRQFGRRLDLAPYDDPSYVAELTRQSEVTVLMGDIHGSSYLTNAIGPELMVAFLDEYLLRMSRLIVKAGGAMDKSLGDSVMGVFGNTSGPHRADSVKAALLAGFEMRQAYFTLREEWQREHPEFANTGMGIGISTGKVKTGTVGPEATMVGPAVNLSSKLSKLAIKGRTESEIYVDVRSHDLIGEGFDTELLDPGYTRRKVGVDLEAYRVIQR